MTEDIKTEQELLHYHDYEMWCYTLQGKYSFANHSIQRGLKEHFLGTGEWPMIEGIDLSISFPMIRIYMNVGKLYKVTYDEQRKVFSWNQYKKTEILSLQHSFYTNDKLSTNQSILQHIKTDCSFFNVKVIYHWYNSEHRILSII